MAEAPRKPRFAKNPMQEQMEAKRKKEEEEAAKKAQGAALAAKLAMWGEPAKGSKRETGEEDGVSVASDASAADAEAGKPKKLDSQLKSLVRVTGVKRGGAALAARGRGRGASRLRMEFNDHAASAEADERRRLEEEAEADKIARVQAQVRAAMHANLGTVVQASPVNYHSMKSDITASSTLLAGSDEDSDGSRSHDDVPLLSAPPQLAAAPVVAAPVVLPAAAPAAAPVAKPIISAPPRPAVVPPKVIAVSPPPRPSPIVAPRAAAASDFVGPVAAPAPASTPAEPAAAAAFVPRPPPRPVATIPVPPPPRHPVHPPASAPPRAESSSQSCVCAACSAGTTVTYESLREAVRKGDPSIKRCAAIENRLSADEFLQVFEISKELFRQLPVWQQAQLRKKTKLFFRSK